MAGIYAVGARSSITKSKLYPIGSHIVVGSSRATAIGIEEGSFYIFAAGDKADSDEMAALVMEGAAHTAAGTWLTHDQVNRIHELKLSALGDSSTSTGRPSSSTFTSRTWSSCRWLGRS